MKRIKLRMTGCQHAALVRHLLPGDGLEAVALALCGRRRGDDDEILTVQRVVSVPYEHCERGPAKVRWRTDVLATLLDEAARRNLGIVKFHSHPDGGRAFSTLDTDSDAETLGAAFSWVDTEDPHASVIMLPGGELYGRAMIAPRTFVPLASIAVAGDDCRFWYPGSTAEDVPEFARRHAQLFGAGTTMQLRRLTIGVVGCSGTGSIVVELLARLGVGTLVLVDPDRVEEKNLNRIVNATREDAYLNRFKVEVAARAIARMGFTTELKLIRTNLLAPDAVRTVAACDVVFGCMDSAEGRHALNRLATFYVIPYLDVGVRLDANGEGGIDQVCGAVHALQPDGSSLLSRRIYTLDRVKAEGLRRTNPGLYRKQVDEGYLRGVEENRPAVISVNAQLASMAVNEFLARLHPYRYDDNADFAVVRTSLIQGETYREPAPDPCPVLARHVGRGDVEPLLDMPELSE